MTTKARTKPCEECGRPIIERLRHSEAEWVARRFCSDKCRGHRDNDYRIYGDIAYIDVSTKKYPDTKTIIDVADLSYVIDGNGKWYPQRAGSTLYVTRAIWVFGKKSTEQMHRRLFGFGGGMSVIPDHKDHDGLNNRRSNLRPTSPSGNSANRKPPGQFKGIERKVLASGATRYRARVEINGAKKHMGTFDSAEEAARAYDEAAYAHWGEFAYLNFPRKS